MHCAGMSLALQQRAADGGCSAATAPAAAAAGHSEPSKVRHRGASQGLKQSRPALAAQRPKGTNPFTIAARAAKRAPDSSTPMPAKKTRAECAPEEAAGAAAATASPRAAAGRATRAASTAAPAGRTAPRLCPTCKLPLVSQGGQPSCGEVDPVCELRRHCRSKQKKKRDAAVQKLRKRGISPEQC